MWLVPASVWCTRLARLILYPTNFQKQDFSKWNLKNMKNDFSKEFLSLNDRLIQTFIQA